MGYGFELRKKTILDKLGREGSVLVKELAKELDASETTIRRDLNELDAEGLLRQVYGGAVRKDSGAPTPSWTISDRSSYHIEEKRRIGKAAAELVLDNDIIYIDPGTTSWEMIPFLSQKKNLTIVSNSIRLIHCLEYIGHHTIIQLGGTLRADRLDTVGTLTQIGVEQLRGFKAFQGGDGIAPDFGLSAVDHESALAAKTILSNARETIALADHSKFEKPSLLYKIVDLDKIDILVTDRALSPEWQELLDKTGVKVIVAS